MDYFFFTSGGFLGHTRRFGVGRIFFGVLGQTLAWPKLIGVGFSAAEKGLLYQLL